MLKLPRYVIVAFQISRKDLAVKNSSHLAFCYLDYVKLYSCLNGNKALLYELYSKCQPCLNLKLFWSKNVIFDIGCSIQFDNLQSGLLDVGLEIQTTNDIPAIQKLDVW